jgi:hypothetical protein
VPGEPLAPRRGIWRPPLSGNPCRGNEPQGRGSPDYLLAAGARRPPHGGALSSAPLPPPNYRRGRRLALPALSGGGALVTVPVGTAPAPHTIPVGMVRVHPPAATPNVRDPLMGDWGGSRRNTHPRTPAPINVNWVLRGATPGGASASMGSIFLVFCLLLPSAPSSVYRESLGRSLFPERPFCPFHPGLPCCPGFGATGGRQFPPSLFGRGMMVSIHHPSRGSSHRTRRGPEALPPHPGGHDAAVPRRLSSAPPTPLPVPPGL